MTFEEFITSIGFRSGISFWGVLAFLMSIGIEIVPKIKWKPWSTLLTWIGTKINANVYAKVDALDKKVDALNNELQKHINDSNIKSLEDTRRSILDFCNSCMKERRRTKEEYDFMIKKCDEYEEYIEKNDIKNGVVSSAIKEIRRLNDWCIQNNAFLKEGEE